MSTRTRRWERPQKGDGALTVDNAARVELRDSRDGRLGGVGVEIPDFGRGLFECW